MGPPGIPVGGTGTMMLPTARPGPTSSGGIVTATMSPTRATGVPGASPGRTSGLSTRTVASAFTLTVAAPFALISTMPEPDASNRTLAPSRDTIRSVRFASTTITGASQALASSARAWLAAASAWRCRACRVTWVWVRVLHLRSSHHVVLKVERDLCPLILAEVKLHVLHAEEALQLGHLTAGCSDDDSCERVVTGQVRTGAKRELHLAHLALEAIAARIGVGADERSACWTRARINQELHA